MKKVLMVLFFMLISCFAFSQAQGEVFSDDMGNDYIVNIPWTLNKNASGYPVSGQAQGVYNTPSFYWMLFRTFQTDQYGYYTYYLSFYSNAMYFDTREQAYAEYDVILRNLQVYENQKMVYNNTIFYIDRSSASIVTWISSLSASTVSFYHSDSGAKKHQKQSKVYKDGGY